MSKANMDSSRDCALVDIWVCGEGEYTSTATYLVVNRRIEDSHGEWCPWSTRTDGLAMHMRLCIHSGHKTSGFPSRY